MCKLPSIRVLSHMCLDKSGLSGVWQAKSKHLLLLVNVTVFLPSNHTSVGELVLNRCPVESEQRWSVKAPAYKQCCPRALDHEAKILRSCYNWLIPHPLSSNPTCPWKANRVTFPIVFIAVRYDNRRSAETRLLTSTSEPKMSHPCTPQCSGSPTRPCARGLHKPHASLAPVFATSPVKC